MISCIKYYIFKEHKFLDSRISEIRKTENFHSNSKYFTRLNEALLRFSLENVSMIEFVERKIWSF